MELIVFTSLPTGCNTSLSTKYNMSDIYVNEEKAVSEIQILINKTFLLFSHHELLMSFITLFNIILLYYTVQGGLHSRAINWAVLDGWVAMHKLYKTTVLITAEI